MHRSRGKLNRGRPLRLAVDTMIATYESQSLNDGHANIDHIIADALFPNFALSAESWGSRRRDGTGAALAFSTSAKRGFRRSCSA